MTAIDLFAGLGGLTDGAEQAGVRVVWFANHWKPAVDIHSANHPRAEARCQDLHQADFTAAPLTDIGLAAPCCQGHSRARGTDRPRHDAARSTAWAVVTCAEVHRQRAWVVENVPEFLQWELYPAWESAMEALGYSVSPHIVDAADHGVPQHRVRVFIICTRSKAPLRLKLPRREHVAARAIVTRAGTWSPVSRMCSNTRARIRAGRKLHGSRFLIAYYGNEKGGRSLDRPIGTITTRDRYALVSGDRMKMLSAGECRDFMGFRPDYILPRSSTLAKHMLGNAVCPPVARDIVRALKGAL